MAMAGGGEEAGALQLIVGAKIVTACPQTFLFSSCHRKCLAKKSRKQREAAFVECPRGAVGRGVVVIKCWQTPELHYPLKERK